MRTLQPMEGGWRALLESSAELGCLLDSEGALLEASPGWRREFGNSSPQEQLGPVDRNHFERMLEACKEASQCATLRLGGNSQTYELRLTRHGNQVALNVNRSHGRLWHDLLTPLNVIEGFAGLLREAELAPPFGEYLADIRGAAVTLRQLIREAGSR